MLEVLSCCFEISKQFKKSNFVNNMKYLIKSFCLFTFHFYLITLLKTVKYLRVYVNKSTFSTRKSVFHTGFVIIERTIISAKNNKNLVQKYIVFLAIGYQQGILKPFILVVKIQLQSILKIVLPHIKIHLLQSRYFFF